ncbi:hypothetical protein A4S06_07565 [Erysipelotrichaceae bacterium MTC7]|nr:hypothetical protein A4S06_07565 [Erysipelotrichaceae bacterium MTC7]
MKVKESTRKILIGLLTFVLLIGVVFVGTTQNARANTERPVKGDLGQLNSTAIYGEKDRGTPVSGELEFTNFSEDGNVTATKKITKLENGKFEITFTTKTKNIVKLTEKQINVVIVFDKSGSMKNEVKYCKQYNLNDCRNNKNKNDGYTKEVITKAKWDNAKAGVNSLVDNLIKTYGKDVSIQFVTFDNGATIKTESPIYQENGEASNSTDLIYENGNYSFDSELFGKANGWTNIKDGFDKANTALSNVTNKFTEDEQNIVFLLGDGEPRLSNDPDAATIAHNEAVTASSIVKKNATVYTLGYDVEVNGTAESNLKSYATLKDNKPLYWAGSIDNIKTVIQSIVRAINEEVTSIEGMIHDMIPSYFTVSSVKNEYITKTADGTAVKIPMTGGEADKDGYVTATTTFTVTLDESKVLEPGWYAINDHSNGQVKFVYGESASGSNDDEVVIKAAIDEENEGNPAVYAYPEQGYILRRTFVESDGIKTPSRPDVQSTTKFITGQSLDNQTKNIAFDASHFENESELLADIDATDNNGVVIGYWKHNQQNPVSTTTITPIIENNVVEEEFVFVREKQKYIINHHIVDGNEDEIALTQPGLGEDVYKELNAPVMIETAGHEFLGDSSAPNFVYRDHKIGGVSSTASTFNIQADDNANVVDVYYVPHKYKDEAPYVINYVDITDGEENATAIPGSTSETGQLGYDQSIDLNTKQHTFAGYYYVDTITTDGEGATTLTAIRPEEGDDSALSVASIRYKRVQGTYAIQEHYQELDGSYSDEPMKVSGLLNAGTVVRVVQEVSDPIGGVITETVTNTKAQTHELNTDLTNPALGDKLTIPNTGTSELGQVVFHVYYKLKMAPVAVEYHYDDGTAKSRQDLPAVYVTGSANLTQEHIDAGNLNGLYTTDSTPETVANVTNDGVVFHVYYTRKTAPVVVRYYHDTFDNDGYLGEDIIATYKVGESVNAADVITANMMDKYRPVKYLGGAFIGETTVVVSEDPTGAFNIIYMPAPVGKATYKVMFWLDEIGTSTTSEKFINQYESSELFDEGTQIDAKDIDTERFLTTGLMFKSIDKESLEIVADGENVFHVIYISNAPSKAPETTILGLPAIATGDVNNAIAYLTLLLLAVSAVVGTYKVRKNRKNEA